MHKPAPELIVESLPTKSAKIRALAAAGYPITEIAKFLDIRYQHVRNVLVQSSGGNLRRSDSRQAPQTISINLPEPWPIGKLLDSGFEIVSVCRLIAADSFEYNGLAPAKPGVYAFVVNDMVAYVGLTRGPLRRRLGHYIYGHEKQRTSARVKGLILAALADGDKVEVCASCPPNLEWNGLPVDGPAGLETGLIRLIRPPWNQQGAT